LNINQHEKYRKLGLNIAYYRKDRGYTQLVLAELLNIDRTHMQKIETANAGVSLDIIFQLSDLLNVPVYKFFEFRD
jgi:transcriptional regulator with XRE-family HTH domain